MTTRPLSELVHIDRASVQPEAIAEGTRYIGLDCIETGGRILRVDHVGPGDLASQKFAFDSRHILFGKLRPNLAKVARPDFSGICSTDILPIRPGSDVDRDYLAHFLLSQEAVAWATSRTSGANLPRLSPAVLGSVPVPLPPLPEQRRIASILDQAQAVSQLADKQLGGLRELRSALIKRAEASPNSTEQTLASFIDRIDSGSSPVCEDREALDGEWGVLKLGAISSGTYRTEGHTKALRDGTAPLTHHEVKVGDVLLSRKNTPELVGASAYVRRTRSRVLLPDLIFRVVVSEDSGVNPAYLQAMLSGPRTRAKLRKIAGGSAASMSNISKARLSLVTLPVASRAAQEELIGLLERIDELTDDVTKRKWMNGRLANALKARAFKGEL